MLLVEPLRVVASLQPLVAVLARLEHVEDLEGVAGAAGQGLPEGNALDQEGAVHVDEDHHQRHLRALGELEGAALEAMERGGPRAGALGEHAERMAALHVRHHPVEDVVAEAVVVHVGVRQVVSAAEQRPEEEEVVPALLRHAGEAMEAVHHEDDVEPGRVVRDQHVGPTLQLGRRLQAAPVHADQPHDPHAQEERAIAPPDEGGGDVAHLLRAAQREEPEQRTEDGAEEQAAREEDHEAERCHEHSDGAEHQVGGGPITIEVLIPPKAKLLFMRKRGAASRGSRT